jgi:3-hydroxybutyryl-CoA dehydratase
MAITRMFKVGDAVPSISKTMAQQMINLFEKSGGKTGPSQFTDEATARETLGTKGTVASGRMSLTFASEMLRRYFGADLYNRNGVIDLRFLRPVRPGDTITMTGKVTSITRLPNGGRVTVEVTGTNQKGDTTAAGSGGCIVPSTCLPAEE